MEMSLELQITWLRWTKMTPTEITVEDNCCLIMHSNALHITPLSQTVTDKTYIIHVVDGQHAAWYISAFITPSSHSVGVIALTFLPWHPSQEQKATEVGYHNEALKFITGLSPQNAALSFSVLPNVVYVSDYNKVQVGTS